MKALALASVLLASGAANAAQIASPGRSIHVKTSLYEFDYSYPAPAGQIPDLKAWLDKDAAKQKLEIAEGAHELRYAPKDEGGGREFFNPFRSSTEWRVVTNLPAWLSLSAEHGELTGGRPNGYHIALLWNKSENHEVKVLDLFVSEAALSAAIKMPYCQALRPKWKKWNDGAIDDERLGSACKDPAAETVILGSRDHLHFTRIGIFSDQSPYGVYEITLPVTSDVMSAVRPEYQSAFAAPLAGR